MRYWTTLSYFWLTLVQDILDDDNIQWHPPLIGHYTNFWPLLILTLLPNLTFYLIVQGFHRTYATGAACQQRTLTPPDTWSCPTLGLACVLMPRPISPELVLSRDLWISNIPRYFSFAAYLLVLVSEILRSKLLWQCILLEPPWEHQLLLLGWRRGFCAISAIMSCNTQHLAPLHHYICR